jgi:hypothetical protein
VEDVMRVVMAGAAARAGYQIDPVDVDPLTFTIGGQSPDGQRPGAGREDEIARAGTLLAGLWHDSALVQH